MDDRRGAPMTGGFMVGIVAGLLVLAAWAADAPPFAWLVVGIVDALFLAIAVRADNDGR